MQTVIYYFVKMGLSALNALGLVSLLRYLVTNLTANPNFTVPAGVLAALATMATELEELIEKSKGGDRNQISLRRTKEVAAKQLVRDAAAMVQDQSGGDKDKILSSGFGVRRLPEPAPLLNPPQRFVATPSLTPDAMDTACQRDKGAKGWILQVATGDPNVETNWDRTIFITTSRYTVTDLTPGVVYYFRIAAVNRYGQSGWSDIAQRMAV